MSKLDAQRAMREAAYAAQQSGTAPTPRGRARMDAAQAPVAPPLARTPSDKAGTKKPGVATAAAPAADDAAESCGHRSMNGRTCTRPAGHTEKNHRYS